jgi:ribonuclease T2
MCTTLICIARRRISLIITFWLLSVGCATPGLARNEAGDFNYYMLVLSWSPTYCETQGEQGRDGGQQCTGSRPYAFVLHGLWPQYEDGWPENCPVRDKPWVPNELVNKMLDIMPSRSLIIHEFKKHGICTGLPAEAYFDTARKLYQSIKIPQKYSTPGESLLIAPSELTQDFTAANPELQSAMMSVSCNHNKLKDIRLCFSRELKLRPCGSSETHRKSCPQDKLVIPPLRGGRTSAP